MSEIFLYTADADVNSMHLKALREAGFVPVKVKSFDNVKLMQRPMPIAKAHLDLAAHAAFMTIAAAGDATKSSFGLNLAKLLRDATDPYPKDQQSEGDRGLAS